MVTNRDSVRQMLQSVLTRLENQKSIQYPPRLRQIIVDEVYNLCGPAIMTEQDLRDKTHAKLGAKTEELADSAFTESDKYKAAKSVVRSTFGDDELNGFYFQRPIKNIAQVLREYLLRSSHIDDVYESDEDLEKQIVEFIKKFRPDQVH